MIELRLPYPPSANRYWRTRVFFPRGQKGAAQVQTYVSADAKEFKDAVGWIARAAGIRAPITGRVAIEYTLHPHRPKDGDLRERRDPNGWEDTVQCLDLDNAQKLLLDALKGVVMDDDKWVREIHGRRGAPVDQGALVVRVTPIVVQVVQADLLGEAA